MSLSKYPILRTTAEYGGGLCAFVGAICLLVGWIRLRDARDFVFSIMLKGEITSDWVAVAFLLTGIVLLLLAYWSGVLTPHSEAPSKNQ